MIKMRSALATENLILQVKSIKLDKLDLHACPFLACQLSVFMTVNLYGGGREIERMMVTQETQEFLDRFGPHGG
jgi:hypothetical protein